jgi:hypothetical protein
MSAFRSLAPIGFKAGGNIAPRSFVKLDTSAVAQVLQCGAGDQVIGAAQQGQRDTPGLTGSDTTIAAASGDYVDVYGLGDIAEVDVVSGQTIAIGDWVKAGTGGLAISHTLAGGAEFVAGRALTGGTAPVTIKVFMNPDQVN